LTAVPALATRAASAWALEVADLSIRFGPSAPDVVRGVSFAIAPGETLALVGESGCGKSATSLAVMGLLPTHAVARGRIAIADASGSLDLARLDAAARRKLCGRRIGMIFQEPMTSLNPMHSIGRQIAEPLTVHGLASKREAAARAVELLRQMGLPDPERRARALPHELSGGMRQRAMIAMALACEPQLLIADEPTTALDVTVQAQILDLLRRLRDDRGMAILFVTHDLALVAEMADRVAVMYSGEIVEAGAVDDVLARPLHPYAKGLLASRPDGARPGAQLAAIPGSVPEAARRPKGCAFHPRCPEALAGVCDVTTPDARHVAGRIVRCLRVGSAVP
jgi:oligopeptide/dipeptide ABC transporter ATP-binding protein